MQNEEFIPVTDFCSAHKIEITFIYALKHNGLIQVTTIEQREFISITEIGQLEKMVRLHHDMDINLEGIETVMHLLQQVESLKNELTLLKNRLHTYET